MKLVDFGMEKEGWLMKATEAAVVVQLLPGMRGLLGMHDVHHGDLLHPLVHSSLRN